LTNFFTSLWTPFVIDNLLSETWAIAILILETFLLISDF
jgi:hypothetical protein